MAEIEKKTERMKEMIQEAYETSAAHGFHEGPHSCMEKLALIHSEVSEALEETRQSNFSPSMLSYSRDGKPEGYPSELADIVIRVFDEAGFHGIDLMFAIEEKMRFNQSRPYKHGKTA